MRVEVFEMGDRETAHWDSYDMGKHVAVDYLLVAERVVGRNRPSQVESNGCSGISNGDAAPSGRSR
jgi:hypothetical protein